MTGDLFRVLNDANIAREDIANTPLTAEKFAGMIKLVEGPTINAATARKDVMPVMLETGKDAATIVEEKGLAQISDPNLIADKVQEAIDSNGDIVQKYLDGNDKVINALFGKTMGALRGKGDPAVVRQVLQEKLDAMKA